MDMFRTLIVICLCLVIPCVLAGSGYAGGRSCNRTFDCRKGQCCRDRKGNLLGEMEGFGGQTLVDSSLRGHCTRRPSRPGQACNTACGCTRGHTCYMTVMGVCCPPRTCWTDEAARKDKEYWDNCFSNPDCHLPP